jgi:predicted nuclease of predicted toxin-antitoxin system
VRILLDECVNPRLRRAFPEHEVVTVAEANLRGLSDVKVIRQARDKCDVLVTLDQGFEHEHNLKNLTFGIIILHVRRNRMEHYLPLFSNLIDAVRRVKPGEVVHVPAQPA